VTHSHEAGPRTRVGQGEAIVVWAAWLALTVMTVVTYAAVDPAELYHVSRDGLDGGLSRALTQVNYPTALVAVALVLVAAGALPAGAWWPAGVAIALCAVVAWPGVVDQDDLDARRVNALPALGVALALGLTLAAARRMGAGFAPRLPGDPVRVAVAACLAVLSLPWLAAQLGFHLPGDVFLGEELRREADGTLLAAVHLGGHHGLYGALLLGSGLLLSRVRPSGGLRGWHLAVTAALAAYGAVNCVQDLWLEQIVKRGWLDWRIPSALEPSADPVWLVTAALAAGTWLLFRLEDIARRPAAATLYLPPTRP
jgi:hypothetical protein